MRSLSFAVPFALAVGAMVLPRHPAQAQPGIEVTVTEAPPELPVYEQPPLPDAGYLWIPGYWAYGDEGYYWVPGTWLLPPEPGLLWTPGYWRFDAGRYLFSAGYWAPEVGWYGGIDYGFGYGGLGYEGGFWRDGVFNYNRAVNSLGSVHVTNVYVRNVTNVTVNRVSFNGPGGIQRQPSPAELAASRAPHVPPTALQLRHVTAASQNHALLANVNHGRPAILATPRPAAFAPHPAAPPREARPPMGAAPAPHPPEANRPEPAASRPMPPMSHPVPPPRPEPPAPRPAAPPPRPAAPPHPPAPPRPAPHPADRNDQPK